MEGSIIEKCCSICDEIKPINNFREGRKLCRICESNYRKDRYKNNPDVRENQTERARILRNEIKNEKELALKSLSAKIGEENKNCKYCNTVNLKIEFRSGRSICKKCENTNRATHYLINGISESQQNYRKSEEYKVKKTNYKKHRKATDPCYRFITNIRARIYSALKYKQKSTIHYLGCDALYMSGWLTYNFDKNITFETYGKEWHIDHVIPLSRFDLEKESEQLLAFNWINTAPLSVKENCSKNNRLISSQIEHHLQKLLSYHNEKNIEMPQEFIDLFARHLAVRETP